MENYSDDCGVERSDEMDEAFDLMKSISNDIACLVKQNEKFRYDGLNEDKKLLDYMLSGYNKWALMDSELEDLEKAIERMGTFYRYDNFSDSYHRDRISRLEQNLSEVYNILDDVNELHYKIGAHNTDSGVW